MTSAYSITASANPPRSVFVDLPLGHTSGLPNDPGGQRRILDEAFAVGVTIAEPGIIEALDYRFIDDDWKVDPLSWSRKRQSQGRTKSKGGDSRTGRTSEPVYQTEDDAAAAATIDFDQQCLACIGIRQPDDEA